MTISVGDIAPDFTLKNQHGEDITLSSFRGDKNVVVVFYPFAFSGVCTGELCELRDNLASLTAEGVELLAVSSDPMFSLRAFADAENYAFSLLSDFWPHGEVAQAFGVFNEQIGAAGRGTFIIDREGVVRWKVEHPIGEARDLNDYRQALAELA